MTTRGMWLALGSSLAWLGACSGGGEGDDAGSGGAPATGGTASGAATGAGGASTGGQPSGGSPATGGAAADGGNAGAGAAPTTGGDSGVGGTGTGGAGADGSGGSPTSGVDVFGITELYPSASSSATWTSEHWSGDSYEMAFGEDENDPSGLSGMRGDGTLAVNGEGELVMSGSQPRIYVYPGPSEPWQNIEVTVYYQRVADAGTAYAGLVVGVRSGPDGHNTDTACDAHTYYARLRHDGAIDFEKELKHPASSTGSRVDADVVWPPDGVLPTGQWIGWKFVIYNLDGASVELEAYRDLTEGAEGGDWELMNELVDDGGWSVETDCAEHDPVGGESDLVVLDGGAVLVRNTEVTEARYRWLSVREIAAP